MMDYAMTSPRAILLLAAASLAVTAVSSRNETNLSERTTNEHGTSTNELCAGETFRPRCSGNKNDVIVILAARYGRMSFGRCLIEEPGFATIANNPKFVGCFGDVKQILDQQCSGLSECDVRITDQTFDGIQPCYAGLKMHLEASYLCIQVAAESRHCTVALVAEPQHIVGGAGRSRQVQSGSVGCGTHSQPWSIEALAGQRIAVSLIDFVNEQARTSPLPSSCHPEYGFIMDKNARRNTSICGNQRMDASDRSTRTTLYVSRSNQLQIVSSNNADLKFIVRIESVGCSDLAPPSDNAWLKRIDDHVAVIGCYMSRQTWQLNCVNGVWTGTVGVCIQTEFDETASKDDETVVVQQAEGYYSSIQMAALVAVASAGVAVCCLVICIGVLCLRRKLMNNNWDFTCPDTLSASHLNRAVTGPGEVANEAEEKKRSKYAELTTQYEFVPIAVETLGAVGIEATAFFQDLGRRISAVTMEPRTMSFLWQRLSVAVQRGNAACIAGKND